jgi:hypothetical protein
VLIIAHTYSRTLDEKLARLEAQSGVPTRFLSAQLLADLRERIPGPLPLRVFTQELFAGGRILDSEFVRRVAEAYRLEQKAHQTFVEGMLVM